MGRHTTCYFLYGAHVANDYETACVIARKYFPAEWDKNKYITVDGTEDNNFWSGPGDSGIPFEGTNYFLRMFDNDTFIYCHIEEVDSGIRRVEPPSRDDTNDFDYWFRKKGIANLGSGSYIVNISY